MSDDPKYLVGQVLWYFQGNHVPQGTQLKVLTKPETNEGHYTLGYGYNSSSTFMCGEECLSPTPPGVSLSIGDGHLISGDHDSLEDAEKPSEVDHVNNPSHYARWPISPATFIIRNNLDGTRSNVVKYTMRAGFKLYPGKDARESEIIDLEKAIRWAQMKINFLKGEAEL